MVYTLTPNPALDLGGVVDDIIPNEKNYVQEETRCPGGNAINVARLLARLGIPSIALGFLGGSVGEEIQALLEREQVKHSFVEISDPSRVSITVSNVSTGQQTRLSFPGPRVRDNEIRLLEKKLRSIPKFSILVIGGSLPPGFKLTHLNGIIRTSLGRKLPVVLDIPGHLLRETKLDGITLIKPNLTEFQSLVGRKIESLATVARAAKKLAQKVRFVCVSSVEDGAIIATSKGVWFGKPPRVTLRTTVGAGDSMVAGMVAALLNWPRHPDYQDDKDDHLAVPKLLQYGLAASAATLSTPGTALGRASNIRKHLSGVSVKKLSL